MTLVICNLCAAHVTGVSKTEPYIALTGHRHAGDKESLTTWLKGMKGQITRKDKPKHVAHK